MDIDIDQLRMAIDTKRIPEQKLLSPEEIPDITETWRAKIFLMKIEEKIILAQEHGQYHTTYRITPNIDKLSDKETEYLLKTVISPKMKKIGWSFSWDITFSGRSLSTIEVNMYWEKPGFWRKFITYLTNNE